MDDLIFKVAAVGIVAVILAVTVKKDNPVFALLITLAASILIFFMLTPRLSAVLGLFSGITERITGGGEYVGVVLKIIGIAYASEFGASVCADAGEAGVASKIELAGKVMIMAVSAPVVLTLLNQVLALV